MAWLFIQPSVHCHWAYGKPIRHIVVQQCTWQTHTYSLRSILNHAFLVGQSFEKTVSLCKSIWFTREIWQLVPFSRNLKLSRKSPLQTLYVYFMVPLCRFQTSKDTSRDTQASDAWASCGLYHIVVTHPSRLRRPCRSFSCSCECGSVLGSSLKIQDSNLRQYWQQVYQVNLVQNSKLSPFTSRSRWLYTTI